MPSRICLEPGCPVLIPARRGVSRCPHHQAIHEARRGTTTCRGYGWQHRLLRAQLLAAYSPTDPCWRCGQPLGDDPRLLDLGHTEERDGWMGLEHAACSRGKRRTA
jgi:hypothetical protein